MAESARVQQIAPLTEEEVEARCALAQSALTPLHSGSPAEWFNTTVTTRHVPTPVMIKNSAAARPCTHPGTRGWTCCVW